jgi:hypothetical protein
MMVAGCGGAAVVSGDPVEATSMGSEQPLLGANGKDAADRSCHVVLRSLNLVSGGPASCDTTGCSAVFEGVVDVSQQAISEGAVVSVMWRNQFDATWTTALAESAGPVRDGFGRYRIRLDRNTFSPGLSATALSRQRLEVAPFVRMPTGARLFDKQRGQSDFENYLLTSASGFAIREEAAVCPPAAVPATLTFGLGFTLQQRGALIANGRATIEYALERLSTCRGTHNGAPAWDIVASARFWPGGEVISGSVRGIETMGGNPSSSNVVAVPWTFDIPAQARSAEIWFRNFTGAGSSCEAYDSNLGANYRFEVEPKPLSPVLWVGRPGSSTSRLCERQEGAPEQFTLDSYIQQRACAFIEADVYVPGLTDATVLKPAAVYAESVARLDGVSMRSQPLTFQSRFGNDYRFRFEVPKSDLYYGPKWRVFEYTLRFSTDGRTWVSDVKRTVLRDPSFCNPAWGDCAL